MNLFDLFLHIDRFLVLIAGQLGSWLYLFIFLIVFCETGLIVTPFLPGDSLLFGIGALCAREDLSFSLTIFLILVPVAALTGDILNYSIGRLLGKKIQKINPPWFSIQHLEKTQNFFLRYGSWAVFLSRFMPFFRTFAPFASGLGQMPARKFMSMSILAAIVWSEIFLWAGYVFGQLPWVKKNMTLIILGVIIVSLCPLIIQILKSRSSRSSAT